MSRLLPLHLRERFRIGGGSYTITPVLSCCWCCSSRITDEASRLVPTKDDDDDDDDDRDVCSAAAVVSVSIASIIMDDEFGGE